MLLSMTTKPMTKTLKYMFRRMRKQALLMLNQTLPLPWDVSISRNGQQW